jgi:LPS-assembly protein
MTLRSYFLLLLICAALLPTPHATMAMAFMGDSEEGDKEDINQGKEDAPDLQTGKTLPILLYADNIDYDQETDMVTATGNVQITQGERLLRAQKVTYNRKTGMMTAA